MNEDRTEQVHIEDMYPVMAEQLAAGGKVTFGPKGTSMLPLIVQGRDSVTLSPAPSKLKKYDIPLYRRESGQFVLHRVVDIAADGTYTMCGDNQCMYEKGIPHSAVVGVVSEILRNGKTIDVNDEKYLAYCKKQVSKNNRRRIKLSIRRAVKKPVKKAFEVLGIPVPRHGG